MRLNKSVERYVRARVEAVAERAVRETRDALDAALADEAKRKKLRAACEKLCSNFARAIEAEFKKADVSFVGYAKFPIGTYLRSDTLLSDIMTVRLAQGKDGRAAAVVYDKALAAANWHAVGAKADEILAKLSLGGTMKDLEQYLAELKF